VQGTRQLQQVGAADALLLAVQDVVDEVPLKVADAGDLKGVRLQGGDAFRDTALEQRIHVGFFRYAGERKLELVTVARLATGDWRFFQRVTEGASFTAKKYDGIVAWFADNWPKALLGRRRSDAGRHVAA
jgi:hypothetical protein